MTNLGKETEQVEFKKSTGELREGVISIASILNKHGEGELYFGVRNNGDVIGQEIADSTLRDISQAVGYHIKPPVYPEIFERDYDGKKVVCVRFKGDRAPYLAYNVPRIRVADEDKVMDQNEYDKLLRARGDASDAWELQVSKKTVDDIIEKDFKLYLYRAKEAGRIIFDSEDHKTVMNKLELLADDGIHLLNAGALLFCRTDLADVQMAKFATDVKATFLDIRREDFGSIIGQSETCIEYIKNAMDWKADIIGTRRVETPEVPVEAVREAVINSFGHRMYNNGQNNEIDVFKDRIEIHTTGGFPEGHTPEEFFGGEQKPIRRNRLITRILYFSKDMETFATGLKRIKDLCDEAGCKFKFRMEKDDFVVAFYRNLRETWQEEGITRENVLGSETTKKLPRNYQENYQETTKKTTPSTTPKTTPKKKKTSEMIKDIMRDTPSASANIIASQIGISADGVRYHIRNLKKTGDIERIGGDKGGVWKVNK